MDKNTLKQYNFNFSKQYGQNFIFDHNLLRAIADDADIAGANVLEIGPGAGNLTCELCKQANKVVAYEIDSSLKPVLADTLHDYTNVQVIFQDIMKANIADIEANFDGGYTIVANLPYYITTPIIFKFVQEATRLNKLVIMVQYEVAERLVAQPNTANYGAITAILGCISNVKMLRKVGRKMFVPAPNVDSAIVSICLDEHKYNIHNFNVLQRVVKSAFAMRRKTLANNLKKDFNLSNDKLSNLFETCGLKSDIRGEVLSPEQFVDLSNQLCYVIGL